MKLNNSVTLSKKRRKNKLSDSSSKFKLKANKSSINFKNKGKFKKFNNDSSTDSEEESESNDDGGKKGRKNRNKSRNKNKKDNKKRNKKGFYNSKRSQSVKTLKHRNKNNMLRKTQSDIKKRNNKFFNRTIQSETNSLRRRNNKNNYFFNKRSQTPNTERYRNNLLKNNKNKFLRNEKLNSAYSHGFNKFKRTSFDHTDKKYRLFTELDERNRKNFLFGTNNRRRDSEDGLKSLNFRTSKYTQNTSNYFKIGSRRFNFMNNYQKEKEDGFFNRITLYPKIEEDNFYERKYLQGDVNNPYSVKWPSHFLEIGYNSGFYYDDYQDGVPILRLRKLNNKIILPPINSRYSQTSERPIEIPRLNFNGLTRQERINFILNTEANNNEHNNVFKSAEARKKLLEKFNVKKNKKNNE